MIRQCCVCKRIFVDGEWVHPSSDPLDYEDVTHGYCELCYEDFMQTVAEYVSLRGEHALATGA